MAFSMDARLIILLSLDKARSSVLAIKNLVLVIVQLSAVASLC